MSNKQARHSNIERIGIFKTGLIVESMGWIFREQTQVDVGIDGIIEQSENGNPTGNFIALQIKSGVQVLRESKKGFTYYMSNVHYEYWLNLNIPIIIVYYNPKNDKLYWKSLNKTTISKAKKRWKIEISKTSEFKRKSEGELTKIIDTHKVKRSYADSDYDSIFELLESQEYVRDCIESSENMKRAYEEFNAKLISINSKLQYYLDADLDYDSPAVITQAKRFATTIEIFNSRLSKEIEIFSQSFAKGLMGYRQLIVLNLELKQPITSDIKKLINGIGNLSKMFEGNVENTDKMLEFSGNIPEKYKKLKKAKAPLIHTLKCMKLEYEDVISLCRDFSNLFTEITNG